MGGVGSVVDESKGADRLADCWCEYSGTVMGELGEIVRVEQSARNQASQRVRAFVGGWPES